MIMIDDTTALVFTTDDLHDAVSSDNGVDHVYFGGDITLAYGITIYPNKPRLVIDGTYDGATRTFTDMESTSYASTLGIRAASSIELTIRNINLVGRNFFGIPYVNEGVDTDNVTVIYNNVTYTGKQMIFHQRGLTRFIDCDITITGQISAQVEEVGQVCKVEIGGQTQMVKTNEEDAVFWFYGSAARRPYLKILSGGNVTITTAHYFMYEYYPPDYIIEADASFTLNTKSGISWNSGHTAASFFVGENASFTHTQAVNRGVATLYIDGALTISQGARFYMEANFPNTNQLIWFTGSSGGLYIDNPKSFVVYNQGTSASTTAFYFASTIPVTLSGGQVNFWQTARPFPTAGTFDDEPAHKWNRPNWSQFTLQGTASASQTNITYNDFTPEELANLPQLDLLQLHQARVLSIGDLFLSVYSTVITRSVTGLSEPYATIKVVYEPSRYEDPQTATADATGLFSLVPLEPLRFSNYLEVFSNVPFLIVSQEKAVRAEDELFIEDAPQKIRFPIRPLAGFDGTVLPRDYPKTPVKIVDTRADKTQWQLWAKILGPLRTEDNETLADAVVFLPKGGTMLTLGSAYMPVHTDGPYVQDDMDVEWGEREGVLAHITEAIRSGKKYTTQLIWTITPLGVVPEEED